jgi:hypothetical protein
MFAMSCKEIHRCMLMPEKVQENYGTCKESQVLQLRKGQAVFIQKPD